MHICTCMYVFDANYVSHMQAHTHIEKSRSMSARAYKAHAINKEAT